MILLTKFPKEASLFLVGVNTKLLQNFSWNQVRTSKLEAPSTSKFETISLAVSRPLPEQRHPADQPAEQVNFKPTVGFNVRLVATSEDKLQASF